MKTKFKELSLGLKVATISGISAVFLILIYAIFLIAVTWPIEGFTIANAGVFGDSFGILTSLFSAMAFGGVAFTLALQRDALQIQKKELEEQKADLAINRKEIYKQGFESTFFQMIKLHNQILSDISSSRNSVGGTVVEDGRVVMKNLENRLNRRFSSYQISGTSSREDIVKCFQHFYQDTGHQLGHYFRFLYNILRFLSDSNIENKQLYSRLLRAQLSNQELFIIYYNALTPYGKNFVPYMQQFKIMDNLDPDELFHSAHSLLIENVGFRET